MADSIRNTVREIVGKYGRLTNGIDRLSDDDDLYDAGMTSHANVNVMLSLEEAFDFEFPEDMLRRSTFESVSAMERAITTLLGQPVSG